MGALKINYKDRVESIDLATFDIMLKKYKRMMADKTKLEKEIKQMQYMFQHMSKKQLVTKTFTIDIKRKRREYILSKDEMIEILGDDYKQYAKTKLIWNYNIIKKVG